MPISRRAFLGSCGACVAGFQLAPTLEISRRADLNDRALIIIQLRGGLDGLAIAAPDSLDMSDRASALNQSGKWLRIKGDHSLAWKLAPAAAPLLPLLSDRRLCLVQGCGTSWVPSGHMEAQYYLDRGVRMGSGVNTGWVSRLVPKPGYDHDLVLRSPAHALGPLVGCATASRGSTYSALMKPTAIDPASAPGLEGAFDSILHAIEKGTLRCAVIDLHGWDTHRDQSARLDPLLSSLTRGLARFDAQARDAGVSERVMVVVVSEFGRTVRINDAAGTEHGRGGVALLMAPKLGAVVHAEGFAMGPAGVHVTIDVHDVLASAAAWAFPTADFSAALPHASATLASLFH